jgi:hypothetical protein
MNWFYVYIQWLCLAKKDLWNVEKSEKVILKKILQIGESIVSYPVSNCLIVSVASVA